jgi:hypothetical protein
MNRHLLTCTVRTSTQYYQSGLLPGLVMRLKSCRLLIKILVGLCLLGFIYCLHTTGSILSRDAPDTVFAGYPAGQSGIRPDTGYKKRPDYPAGYPVHP